MPNRDTKLAEDLEQRIPRSIATSLDSRLKDLFARSKTGLAKTGFAKKVAVLSSGTVIAQAINFLLIPVITRLYLPASIGQLALFTSFLSMAAVAVSLRYELGIISAQDEREASQLAFLSILFSVPFSLVISALLFVLIRFSLFGFGALPQYAALIMVPVLLSTGAFGSLRYWEIRRERYAVVSRSAVMQHGGRSVFQVVTRLYSARESLAYFLVNYSGAAWEWVQCLETPFRSSNPTCYKRPPPNFAAR